MRSRRAARVLGAALVALFLLPGVAAGAAAQPLKAELSEGDRESALWYARDLKFDEIRDMGLTGKGVTIAVIDTAINLDAAEVQGADIEVKGQFCKDATTGEEQPAETDDPELNHGTSVVSMLVGNGVANDGGLGTRGIVPKAKVLFYASGEDALANCELVNPVSGKLKFNDFLGDDSALAGVKEELNGQTFGDQMALAAAQALEDGADVISISSSALFEQDWSFVQSLAMRKGVPIVASTPNPDSDFRHATGKSTVPRSLNGAVAVGGVDQSGEPASLVEESGIKFEAPGSSNLAVVGPAMNILDAFGDGKWEAGISQGTSLAAPLVAGTVALGMEKYPDASGFQVLQAMIRTTGAGELQADPGWIDEQHGYGFVNPVAMLAVDPTQFPNENPLFVKSPKDPRCGGAATSMDECEWAYTPTAEEVWPAGEPGQQSETEEPKPGETNSAGGAAPALVWASVSVLTLGVIAAAIAIPIMVSRSRKKKQMLAGTQQQGWPIAQQGYSAQQQGYPVQEQAYPQQGYPVAPQPAPEPPPGAYPPYPAPPAQPQYLPQQPPNFEGEY